MGLVRIACCRAARRAALARIGAVTARSSSASAENCLMFLVGVVLLFLLSLLLCFFLVLPPLSCPRRRES